MKKVILVILVAIAANNVYAQYFPVDTTKLNSAYRELVNAPNTPAYQKAFFDAFPSTWMEFIMTYQYVPNDKYDLTMYRLAEKQIAALGEKVTSIPDSIYFKKLVNLAVGGSLDADAPNYLRSLLRQKMKDNPKAMFKALSQLRKGHQMQFWQFYWSNICKSKELENEFAQMKKLYGNTYAKEVQMMSDAYKYFYDGINFPTNFPTIE